MLTATLIIIRTAIHLLSLVSARKAGDLAFWIFSRPPKASKINPFQKSLAESGERLLNQATKSTARFDDPDGRSYEISIYTLEPTSTAKGTTLLLHGWSSRASHMLAFASPLLKSGYRVIAVDFPAHGLSSGRHFHLPLGVQALEAVRKITPEWNSIIAHSLGGAVATTLISGGIQGVASVSIDKLVLISTPNSIPKIFADFSDMLKLSAAVRSELDQHVIRLSGRTIDTFIGRDQLIDAAIPTLILHDPDDKEVPFQEAVALGSGNTMVEQIQIANVGHRRILTAPEVVTRSVEFCIS